MGDEARAPAGKLRADPLIDMHIPAIPQQAEGGEKPRHGPADHDGPLARRRTVECHVCLPFLRASTGWRRAKVHILIS